MTRVREHLTYANVMSTLAVFLVLGGATAFAASKKIGAKQLKSGAVTAKKLHKGAVTAPKIRKNAVTTRKIRRGAVRTSDIRKGAVSAAKIGPGAVTGAAVADGSLTGADIASATLGNVPSASSVNGQVPTKIFRTLNAGESNVTVASFGGFSIVATCTTETIDLILVAPPGSTNVLAVHGSGQPNGTYFEYDSEQPGTNGAVRLDGSGSRANDYGEASFTGATNAGAAVSGAIGYDFGTFRGEPPNTCLVYGHALSG